MYMGQQLGLFHQLGPTTRKISLVLFGKDGCDEKEDLLAPGAGTINARRIIACGIPVSRPICLIFTGPRDYANKKKNVTSPSYHFI
jgi:hypothetical protein